MSYAFAIRLYLEAILKISIIILYPFSHHYWLKFNTVAYAMIVRQNRTDAYNNIKNDL